MKQFWKKIQNTTPNYTNILAIGKYKSHNFFIDMIQKKSGHKKIEKLFMTIFMELIAMANQVVSGKIWGGGFIKCPESSKHDPCYFTCHEINYF